MIPGNATITVVRRVRAADRYGDLQPTTATPARHDITGCLVAPRSSNDLSGPGRQGVLVGMSVYAPTGSDVVAGDQIEFDGALFEIDGDIGRWRSPLSGIDGLEFAIRRAVG